MDKGDNGQEKVKGFTTSLAVSWPKAAHRPEKG